MGTGDPKAARRRAPRRERDMSIGFISRLERPRAAPPRRAHRPEQKHQPHAQMDWATVTDMTRKEHEDCREMALRPKAHRLRACRRIRLDATLRCERQLLGRAGHDSTRLASLGIYRMQAYGRHSTGGTPQGAARAVWPRHGARVGSHRCSHSLSSVAARPLYAVMPLAIKR